MAEATGWHVYERKGPGSPYEAKVYDKLSGKRISKRFKRRGDAERWARDEAAMRQLGLRGETMTDTADLIRQWLEDLELNRSSSGYICQVRNRLSDFAKHVPDLGRHDARAGVQRWWTAVRRRPDLAAVSANAYLSSMRAFVSWCQRMRHIVGEDPAGGLNRVREPQHIKPQFELPELRRLLEMTNHRGWQAATLGILAGLRVSEAYRLKKEDLHPEKRLLFVRAGKGDKDRWVPMQARLGELIDQNGFTNYEVAAPSSYHRLWVSLLKAAGIEAGGRTFHSLRHGYAGLMTATGEPSLLVQGCMGHSQQDMTARYAKLATIYKADPEVASWPRGELRL